MFNKEGIPFFVIVIPFLSIFLISFLAISYNQKLSNNSFELNMKEYKELYLQNNEQNNKFDLYIKNKIDENKIRNNDFSNFMLAVTSVVTLFMAFFSYIMILITKDVVKKYKNEVEQREEELHSLNENLSMKVQSGIDEGKQKDKKILEQAKLARIGSMISMIAHQWRQPLTELSGILMELETATRFKKVNEKHILGAIERSDKMIQFMSNTIDDFRNFYRPDKVKEEFLVSNSCKNAINIIGATLKNFNIKLNINVENDKKIYGYPTEFSQVILNILSNAADILVEKSIKNPQIDLNIDTKGILSIITIKDNAGGIAQKNQELIFDPYFSTKDSSKGTGLGLYISKLIVERNMGGELSVYNDDKGAVFKIVVAG
ncbi:MAG: HAMP domain-containing histidine kinase [Aliarcobacter sp.]|nr:HAMP domain-containing histidine kinase [Aliarcobacter sp.]